MPTRKNRLVIAGASGFIGTRLLDALAPHYRIIALSRGHRKATSEIPVEWRKCDLFSLPETIGSLEGADLAIYLVHSMTPQAQLTQATFSDLDALAADNFRRAAEAHGVRQIIYVSGLTDRDGKPLSTHLSSRGEVERVLRSQSTALTVLRAGLVVGAGGSSHQILVSLVKKLPLLICPAWTQTLTTPIGVNDLVQLIQHCIDRPQTFNQVYEVGGQDSLSYRTMLATVARVLGVRRFFINVPWFSPALSKLWIRLISGQPRELVHPLIDSLKTSMVPRSRALEKDAGIVPATFEEALQASLPRKPSGAKSRLKWPTLRTLGRRRVGSVCSIQRFDTRGRTARQMSEAYFHWLPTFFSRIIRVESERPGVYSFHLVGMRRPLLKLHRIHDFCHDGYEYYRIASGLLVRPKNDRGRLEFRTLPKSDTGLIAIHDYQPRMPWELYRITQANFHLWVMRAFAGELRRLE